MGKKKQDPAAELAEKMLAALQAQRPLGSGAYPPTLGRLVQLADPNAAPELVSRALAKAPLKQSALAFNKSDPAAPILLTEDIEQFTASDELLLRLLEKLCTAAKPLVSLSELKKHLPTKQQKAFTAAVEARVRAKDFPSAVDFRMEKRAILLFLKRLPPPPILPPDQQLAEKMLAVLQAQRQLGGDAYPLSLQRLKELTQPSAPATLLKKALAHSSFRDRVEMIDAKEPEAPIAFAEDRQQLLQLCRGGRLLETLVRARRKHNDHALKPESLLNSQSTYRSEIEQAVNHMIETGTLPPSMGWIWIGKKRFVFLVEDMHTGRPVPAPSNPPTAPIPAAAAGPEADFARIFEETFTRLDRHKGLHNFVSLAELRPLIPLSREAFDGELRKLRVAARYTLSAAEGRHGISDAERNAGIVENGSLLLYVSRKNS